ncbi:hypothetical protein E2C01_053486 [Portunus trituberculatus]|uniref:Uncharacterized protein n=1 Tax=Portunus trituberculatus TaxID=210409 RepID=A0A5B7GQF7_PORTR|nr:hypothetical protein [Portunus trituberculatus]
MLTKRVRNASIHARHYYICFAFHTQRWVSVTETVIISGEICIIYPLFPPTGGGKTPDVPQLWGLMRTDWKNRTIYIYEIVVGRP